MEYTVFLVDLDNCLVQNKLAHYGEKLPGIVKRAALAMYEFFEFSYATNKKLSYNPNVLRIIRQRERLDHQIRLVALTNRSALGLFTLLTRDKHLGGGVLSSFDAVSIRTGIFDGWVAPHLNFHLNLLATLSITPPFIFRRKRLKPHRHTINDIRRNLLEIGIIAKEITVVDDSQAARNDACKNGHKAHHPADPIPLD